MNTDNDIEKGLLEDERISSFLKGEMSADDERTFLEGLKMDETLRSRAIAQARLVKGMKQADEELLNAFRNTSSNEINRISRKKTSHFQWYAIAASIVLFIFVGIETYDYYDTVSLGKEYAQAFPVSSIVRGNADNKVENELAILFDNIVADKDLSITTSRLYELWKLAKQDTYNDYTNYAPYIGWYLSVGYLRDYEKDKAMNILNEMAEIYPVESGIGDKVREIIDEI